MPTDKMPTGPNANKRLAFSSDFFVVGICPSQFLVGIWSGPSQHVLAFCLNHENHRMVFFHLKLLIDSSAGFTSHCSKKRKRSRFQSPPSQRQCHSESLLLQRLKCFQSLSLSPPGQPDPRLQRPQCSPGSPDNPFSIPPPPTQQVSGHFFLGSCDLLKSVASSCHDQCSLGLPSKEF